MSIHDFDILMESILDIPRLQREMFNHILTFYELDFEKAYNDYAKSCSKDSISMTDEDKKQAILDAVLKSI